MSLKRLLSLLILLCAGPLTLLVVYLAISSVITKQVERDIEATNLVNNFAAIVEQHLRARIGALHMLATSTLVDDSSRWKDLYLEAQGFHRGFGSHVILADADMRMLFNTRVPFGAKLPMLSRPRGRAAAPAALKTGKPAVGDVFFGPIAKEPLVAVAVPANRNGKTPYLLLTIFETRQFQQHLDHVNLPAGWALTLLDGKNEVIARRSSPDLNSPEDVDASGRFVVKSAVSLWSVLLEIPRNIYYKPLIDAATTLTGVIFVVGLVSIMGGILAAKRLERAIASLAGQASREGVPPPNIREVAAVRRLLDDLTDRQQRYKTDLQESEERYRSFFNNSIDAVLITSPDGRILDANPEACRMFGWTMEELQQLGRAGVVDSKDPHLEPALEQRDRTGRFKGELTFLRKDGTAFPGEVSSAVFTDRNGNLRTSMTIRDMTEQKKAEAEIQKEQDFTGSIIDSLPGIFYMYDDNRRFMRWNKNFERVSGYTGAEIVRMSPLDFFAGREKDLLDERIREVFTKGASDVEADFVGKDGSRTPHYFTGTSIMIDNIRCLIGVGIDISNRRKAESALHESEQRFRALLENQMLIGVMLDLDGRVVFCNEFLLQLTGYTREEVIGCDWFAQFVPAARKDVKENFLQDLSHGEIVSRFENPILTKDGRLHEIRFSNTILRDIQGVIIGTASIGEDITEHKRNEEQIYQLNNRLEYLIQVIQQLSHTQSLQAIADAVRTAARKLVGADGAAFVLRDGNECFYMDEDAMSPLWKGCRFPMERCISGWAMLHREMVVIEDIFQDNRIPHDLYRRTFVQSMAVIPIHIEDPYGAIGVYWAKKNHLGDDELLLIQTLANATAIAMENIRSYQELEKRVQERTTELETKIVEFERMHRLFVGRELRMAELKEKIRDLESKDRETE